MQLFEAAVSFARRAGAKALYVSAAPTENTVDFSSTEAAPSRLSPIQRSWLPSRRHPPRLSALKLRGNNPGGGCVYRLRSTPIPTMTFGARGASGCSVTSRALARAGAVEQNSLDYMVVLEVDSRALNRTMWSTSEARRRRNRKSRHRRARRIESSEECRLALVVATSRRGSELRSRWRLPRRVVARISRSETSSGVHQPRLDVRRRVRGARLGKPDKLLLVCELDRPVCDAACEVCP